MSDGDKEPSAEGPPARKSMPWSVRKIVEQVTGQSLEAMQGPGPVRHRTVEAPAANHADPEPEAPRDAGTTVLVRREPETSLAPAHDLTDAERFHPPLGLSRDGQPSLLAFLPGVRPTTIGRVPRVPKLPISRPLPDELMTELAEAQEDGEVPRPVRGDSPRHRKELERIYLSYLLLHLDHLAEPALKYLRHAVQEECENRGFSP